MFALFGDFFILMFLHIYAFSLLILRVVNKNNKLNAPYFSKPKAKPLFLLTTAILDIYTFLPPVSAYLFIFPHQPDIGMLALHHIK